MQGSAPVKYIVGILTNDLSLREHALHLLSDHLGETDYITGWYPFAHAHTYATEMGENLERSFASFKKLYPPEHLVKVKELTIKVEDKFREDHKRRVNIDPGYIDHFKVVLASGKFAGQRIAVAKWCYADMLMYYEKGKFVPLPWCYPDFASGTYEKDMLEMRRIFKASRST